MNPSLRYNHMITIITMTNDLYIRYVGKHNLLITGFRDSYQLISDQSGGNSLAPGRSEFDSKNGIFNLVLLIGIFRSSHDSALRSMPQDLTDDKSTLVQVRAWCHQATSHYLGQCWPSPLSPLVVARPKWVNFDPSMPICKNHWIISAFAELIEAGWRI